jgi:hypothetical protein
MTATVTGDSIALDGGTGDNLPAQDSAVTMMKAVTEAISLVGDNLQGVGFYAAKKGRIMLMEGATIHYAQVVEAGQTVVWVSGSGETNPVAGDDVDTIAFSHGYSGGAAAMSVGVLNT